MSWHTDWNLLTHWQHWHANLTRQTRHYYFKWLKSLLFFRIFPQGHVTEQESVSSTTTMAASSMTATQEELKANRVPLAWRDSCSAYVFWSDCFSTSLTSNSQFLMLRGLSSFSLLIPLNVCRKKMMYKVWECDHERHIYEKWVYIATCRHAFLISQLSRSAGANMMSTSRRLCESHVIQLLTHNFSSYVRRMKELSKQKVAAAEEAAE